MIDMKIPLAEVDGMTKANRPRPQATAKQDIDAHSRQSGNCIFTRKSSLQTTKSPFSDSLPSPGYRLLAVQIFLGNFYGDRAEGVVADADPGDVGQQVVGPPAVPAVVGFHPEDELGGGFGDRALHRAAADDGHDLGGRLDPRAGDSFCLSAG